MLRRSTRNLTVKQEVEPKKYVDLKKTVIVEELPGEVDEAGKEGEEYEQVIVKDGQNDNEEVS